QHLHKGAGSGTRWHPRKTAGEFFLPVTHVLLRTIVGSSPNAPQGPHRLPIRLVPRYSLRSRKKLRPKVSEWWGEHACRPATLQVRPNRNSLNTRAGKTSLRPASRSISDLSTLRQSNRFLASVNGCVRENVLACARTRVRLLQR